MNGLERLDIDNKRYYLLDNARVHKTKKFSLYLEENKMNLVYNAPYTQDKKCNFLSSERTMNKYL